MTRIGSDVANGWRRSPNEDCERRDFGAALFVSSRNCEAVFGVPWSAALALARRHSVPVLALGSRRRLLSAADLAQAIRAEQPSGAPLTVEEEARRILRDIGDEPTGLTEREEADLLLRSWGLERKPEARRP